jgi:protein-tyrosine phosphatase
MNSNLPYKINWLSLHYLGFPDSLAIGSLPGCKHRFINRDLNADTDVLLNAGIRNSFVLVDDMELQRFGVRNLVDVLNSKGINCKQYPCELGMFPPIEAIMEIIKDIFHHLENGQKSIIISRDGFGRSCVVGAAMLLHTDDNILHDEVYATMKRTVGPRAVQTVKQYNFLVDFRQLRDKFEEAQREETTRCISR